MKKLAIIVWAMIAAFLLSGAACAGDSDNRAIAGLSTAKAYFDVKVGEPAKLVTRLRLIDQTFDQLIEAGVKPEFIIGFRGKASYFLTRGEDYVFEEEVAAKKKVHELVKHFRELGMLVEQCKVAAGLHDIDPEDFLPDIDLVRSGYIFMIGYQAKGYSLVPMD